MTLGFFYFIWKKGDTIRQSEMELKGNIQGCINLIQKIEGEFSNILGLPMGIVYNALEKLGVEI